MFKHFQFFNLGKRANGNGHTGFVISASGEKMKRKTFLPWAPF